MKKFFRFFKRVWTWFGFIGKEATVFSGGACVWAGLAIMLSRRYSIEFWIFWLCLVFSAIFFISGITSNRENNYRIAIKEFLKVKKEFRSKFEDLSDDGYRYGGFDFWNSFTSLSDKIIKDAKENLRPAKVLKLIEFCRLYCNRGRRIVSDRIKLKSLKEESDADTLYIKNRQIYSYEADIALHNDEIGAHWKQLYS